MKGYVAKKGDRWYAVIYEGLDPVTGKVMALTEIPQGCSSKFLTLGRV